MPLLFSYKTLIWRYVNKLITCSLHIVYVFVKKRQKNYMSAFNEH